MMDGNFRQQDQYKSEGFSTIEIFELRPEE
jgi:hypothetical protein